MHLEEGAEIAAVMSVAAREGAPLVGIGFRNGPLVGEYFVDKDISLQQNGRELMQELVEQYGVTAEISYLLGDLADRESLLRIAESLPESGRKGPTPAPQHAFALDAEARRTAASGSSGGFGTMLASAPWAPGYASIEAIETNGQAYLYGVWTWDTRYDSPRLLHDDWGMEFEVRLYNESITGTRPFCPSGTDDNFWAARGTAYGEVRGWSVWGQGASDIDLNAIGAYFDGNDSADPCSRQGFSVGLGYPQNIPTPDGFGEIQTLIWTDLGNQSSSVMDVIVQAVSNDCNNRGAAPGSWCMGLNTDRDFPGPGNSYAYFLNKSRGYRAPGCVTYASGWSAPNYGTWCLA